MTLVDGTQVRLDSGAQFRAGTSLAAGVQVVQLDGGAHFRREYVPPQPGIPETGLLIMVDRAVLASAGAEFVVRMHRETTYVDVIDRNRPPRDSSEESVGLMSAKGQRLRLHAGERGRILRSDTVEKLAPVKKPDAPAPK
jgi:ferric-dicitrate binding protein FerR (iron transport regulator)